MKRVHGGQREAAGDNGRQREITSLQQKDPKQRLGSTVGFGTRWCGTGSDGNHRIPMIAVVYGRFAAGV